MYHLLPFYDCYDVRGKGLFDLLTLMSLLLYKGPYAFFVKHDTKRREIFDKKTPQIQYAPEVFYHTSSILYMTVLLKYKTNSYVFIFSAKNPESLRIVIQHWP